MGLRCLLGHDFTEPEIEREREEEGEEVVTTVREVKTCARCGETQIVSENTEVTTIEQLADQATTAEAADPDDIGGPQADPATTDASATDAPTADSDPTASIEGAEDGSTTPRSGATSVGDPELGRSAGGLDDAAIDDDDLVDDDAVILDETDAEESSSGGSVDPSSDRAADPSHETDAAPGGIDDEDAELIDEGPDSADDRSGSPGSAAGQEGPTAGPVDHDPADDGPVDSSVEESAADDAETDDGVILDEGASAGGGERERGAWPTDEESVDERSDPTPWPEQRGEDEGYSAEPGGRGDADVEFGGSLTPEATDPSTDVDSDTEYVGAPDEGVVAETGDTASTTGSGIEGDTSDDGADGAADDSGSGITRGESPELERRPSNVASEYYCPECGMTMDTDGNSMRAGDICPQCKRGYVDERPR